MKRALIAALVVLSACSSSAASRRTKEEPLPQSSIDQRGLFDVTVYLCTKLSARVHPDGYCTSGRGTVARIAAVREALTADDRVTTFTFVNARQALTIARRSGIPGVDALEPGDLPEEFLINLEDTVSTAEVAGDYQRFAGVDTVRCRFTTCGHEIYLELTMCPAAKQPGCQSPATAGQIGSLRRRLARDPDVARVRYFSAHDVAALSRPTSGPPLSVNHAGPTFALTLFDRRRRYQVMLRYQHVPGLWTGAPIFPTGR